MVLISQILMLVLSSTLIQFGLYGINLHITIIDECPSNFPMKALVIDTSGHHTFTNISNPKLKRLDPYS